MNLVDASVQDLQAALQRGAASSVSLVDAYFHRIETLDRGGPKLNAVIETNPEARALAARCDEERRAGRVRGPLHGIPVLLKDNIATADRMQTTAGSLALLDGGAPRDASVVTRLREAGAVILGKTNLSEWANFRSSRSTSGWSSRGGLTRNPHALDRSASGSSSGSAVAVAASLAPVAVGTETDGSIVSPSSQNGIVGIKPTQGLLPGDGIVPIAASLDTAGPMARTVADAAALLGVLAGRDYAASLDAGALAGKRIGVVRSHFGGRNDLVSAVIEQALQVLQAQGAELVDLAELPNENQLGASRSLVMLYEFHAGIAAYLAEYAPRSPHKSLADLVAFNERERDRVMPHFGQEVFLRALDKGAGLAAAEYREALATLRRLSREEGMDRVLGEHRLDALVAPTGHPACLIDLIRGDFSLGGFSTAAACAGYPHITVPAGFVHGLPCGLSFVGTAGRDAEMIALAFAYEQASRARRAPQYLASAAT
ncbi:amidase [Ramlibacter sp. XY19]|uniref:amidase n=1 Tax=Ramlibacter paludis TaxID=2908000 RepID=UPI0023DC220E|nr:amidase [Ramlibacter paludis]MCG2592890.1 amidase [Ramlibacter paludis]